jgi:hypothetical protein
VPTVAVPQRLAPAIRALGAAGEVWLAQLPALLAGLQAPRPASWPQPPRKGGRAGLRWQTP